MFAGKPRQVQVKGKSSLEKMAGWVPWLLSNALHLKRLINSEQKYIDSLVQITGVSNSGVINFLTGTAQGTDENNRIGRTIKPMYIHFNGATYLNSVGTQAQIRFLVVVDSETNGANPTTLDILQSADPLSQYNITTSKGRFRVIYDKLCMMNTALTRECSVIATRKLYQKIQYEGTGATVASASKYHLFSLFITDQTVNLPDVVFNFRVRFVDN